MAHASHPERSRSLRSAFSAAWVLSWAVLAIVAITSQANAGQRYDPLMTESREIGVVETVVHDDARHRDVPLRLYLPAGPGPAPVLLFSHGLGGSREGSIFLGRHWAAHGYVAAFLQHPGSDSGVWEDQPPSERASALRRAANRRNLIARVFDVSAVLDQLERWNQGGDPRLAGRLDLGRIGMSGHSFGAVTTQAVSGQMTPWGSQSVTDARIRAALVLSPSMPKRWVSEPARVFGQVRIPWLLMTGTRDHSVLGETNMASRLAVFQGLPPGNKFELLLDGAEHSVFTDRPLPGEKAPRNPNHHRAILAISTAFWDAYLRGDPQARAWLQGDGPASVLEAQDRWQKK